MSEIITFGEAMIRLTPPDRKRLEQADALDVEIGGAELNTAVGLARLGRDVGWVSRLPNQALGRLVANRAREAGVTVDGVLWSDHDRLGLYFLEAGAAPRPSSVLYDRADSALAHIAPGMVPWAKVLTGARWFYVTGITPAVSPSAAAATLEALQAAKAAGVRTCIDPNYRAKLWSPSDAALWLEEAMPSVDVLVTNPEDADRFFGIAPGEPQAMATALVAKYRLRACAMTLRQVHSVWRNGWTAFGVDAAGLHSGPSYEVEIVDRLGAGDAFVSGLLHGLLDDDLAKGIDYGTAMSALKHTVPGDLPWITRDEVEGLLAGGGLRIRR